jgi:hypothetical protein
MALVKFFDIAACSGSAGGKTYSHNRYGAYVRNRSIPVNPSSSRQQAARNAFSAAAVYWSSTLSSAERQAWNDYAAAVPVLNALGDSVYLTGFAMFLRSASLWLNLGLSAVEAGPTVLSLPDVDATFTASISEATQLISVAFDDNAAWCSEDDAFMSLYMMKPCGVGRNYLVGHQKMAGKVDGDSGTPVTSPQTIACPFVATEDQKVIVAARIGRADGRLSNLFQDSVDVAA